MAAIDRCAISALLALSVGLAVCGSALADAPQSDWSLLDRARTLNEDGDTAAAVIELNRK